MHGLGKREMVLKSPRDFKCGGKPWGTGVTGTERWDSAVPKFPPLQWEPTLPSKGSRRSEARTGQDAVLQVKAGKIREGGGGKSDKAPHLWPLLMVTVSKRLPRTDNKVDVKLPVLPPHQHMLFSCLCSRPALYYLINFLSMSDVTSKYGLSPRSQRP